MKPERIFGRYDVVDNESFKTAADKARSDPSQYSHLPGLSSIEDTAPYFLVSSRFIERKNLSCLLNAYQAYRRDKASGWRLIILGTGPLEDDLKQQVAAGEIPDVTFAGFHQFDDLVAYYAFAGALIHPALQEQWGLVVNEAMACGLPVGVSQTVGASYDLVKDGVNGFRFDPASSASIQETLSRLSSEGTDLEKFSRESLDIISEWTPRDFAENFWAAVRASDRVY